MINRDKLLHMIAGVLILCFGIIVGLGYLFAFVLVVAIGAAKEGYDYLNRDKHTPEIMDFIATVVLAGVVDVSFYINSIIGDLYFPYMLFVG